MSTTASIKIGSTTWNFDSWQQRPEMPRPVLETTTRLGGKNLIVQKLRTESQQTQCTATMVSNASTVAASVNALENTWSYIRKNFGIKGIWTDENSIAINNFYIIDGTRSIKVQEGLDCKAVMTMTLTVAVDGEDYAD